MGKRKSLHKKIWQDIIILSLFPILAVFTSLTLRLTFITSTVFFFCLPALYLSLRTPKAITRSLVFSIPFSLISVLIIDHLAALDRSWYVSTIFPFKIFNTVPIEDIFLGFSFVYLITIFYEHFLDKGNHTMIGKRMKYFSFAAISFLALFIFIIYTNNQLLYINYWYLKGGILIMLIPAIAFFFSFPRYIGKFLKTSPYFFFVGLSQELTSLNQGYWNFPGNHYIGWISLIGYKLPLEELFFWIIIFSVCILCYFEFFDDNRLLLSQSLEVKLLKTIKKKRR